MVVRLLAVGGLLSTAIAMGLVFIPPGGTTSVINYEANLIGQAALLLAVGLGFYAYAAVRARRA